MRKFILYNSNKSLSFNLQSGGVFAGEPKGLGNKFTNSYIENENNKYRTNVKPNFENIEFTIYFNTDSSIGYSNYHKFTNFLTKNKNSVLILEYDDGVQIKYCRCYLSSLSKTERQADGTFKEKLILERNSYWYKEENFTFEFKTIIEGEFLGFPLQFPIQFNGTKVLNRSTITNDFFEKVPVNILIKGPIANPVQILMINEDEEEVARIKLNSAIQENEKLEINAINGKKITLTTQSGTINAYDILDKNYQSFFYLPPGKYTIITNLTQTDTGYINLVVISYILD